MPKKEIAIRRATAKDLDRLVEFQIQIRHYHRRFDKTYRPIGNSAAIKKHLRPLLSSKKDRVYVLLFENRIVGFATAHIQAIIPIYVFTKKGHIGTVFIEKPYRKLGLGKMAIDESVKWFKKNNITYADLAVDTRNHAGVAAWKRLGFGEWRLVLRRKI